MRLVPNKYSMTAALMLLAGGSYAAPPAELPAAMLDWQVYEQRPVGQVCQGFYLSPELELPEQNTNLAAARLFAESRQLNYSPDGGLLLQDDVRLRKGGIYVTADQAQVNADRTRADLFGNLVVRQDNLLLRGATGSYQLETKHLQLSEAHYVIHQQRLRGSAWQLEQLPDGRVTLRDASLTTCAPGNQAWRLVAGRLNLNRESGFGDAYNVRMEIQQVPVFYWPWLRFPIDDRRHTGLLSPYISYSGSGRLDYQQPFYWNMAPNYDATFYPRYISDRGFMLGAEFRYLQPSDSGELYYAQLGGDELYYGLDRWHFAARHRGSLSRPASLNYSLDFSQVSDDRYFDSLGTNNLVGSDRELLQQFRMSYRQDVWQSRLTFKGYQQLHPSRDPNLSLSDPANAETPYKLFDLKQGRDAARQSYFQLPQLEVRGGSRLGDDTRWFLLADATHFTKLFDESVSSRYLTTSTPIPGQPDSYYVNSRNNWGAPDAWRLHLEPGLRTDWVWPWAFISPQVKLRHNQYWIDPYWQDATSQNQIKTVNLEPSYTVPVLSIDTGLYLERDTRILGHDLLQTLEPRLFAAYIPYVEQYEIPNFFDGGFADSGFNQMFRAERTTGRDRTGDVQKVTAGLTQRIISRYSGQEMASLGIAREFYAADRLLDNSYRHPDDPNRIDNQPREERPYTMVRPYSNLAIQAQWRISRDWQLRSNLLWDDHFSKTESANTYLAYTDMQGFRMNFGHSYSSNYLTHLRRVGGVGPKPESSLMDGYSYKRDAEEQVYASIIYPINDHWRVFAKQGHDWKRNEKLESLTGFEYNSCCWQLQLLYRDWVKNPDTSPGYNQATGFAARERDYGVFLQVVFKGLGGVGQGTRDLLSTEIQGYTDR